jgi:hypothetical protein
LAGVDEQNVVGAVSDVEKPEEGADFPIVRCEARADVEVSGLLNCVEPHGLVCSDLFSRRTQLLRQAEKASKKPIADFRIE